MYPRTSYKRLRRISSVALLLLSAAALWSAAPAGRTAAFAAPQITSLSAGAVTRSGRLIINGTGFGATQADGRVGVGGASAHVSRWSDTQIVAYVSEQAPLGAGSVRVLNGGGASNLMPVEVTARPAAADRVKWRFTMDADYAVTRPALGADGTIYVNDVGGNLYALTPGGALKWVYRAGLRGGYGPVTVGGDGTIYVASLVNKPDGTLGSVGAIHAVNPDGTEKWVFNQTGDMILAGPNVGPDGKIYAVTDLFGIGLFALSPAGDLLYQRGRFFEDPDTGRGQEIVFGPAQMYFGFDSQSKLYSYGLGGDLRWSAPALAAGVGAAFQAAVGPNGNVHVTSPSGSLTAYDPQGKQVWNFNESPNNIVSAPAVGPDNAAYVVRNNAMLHALNPNGTARWRFYEETELYDPAVSPSNDLVFVGGRVSMSGLSFFQAVSVADGQPLWKVLLPHEPGFGDYGQIFPNSRPLFSADGRTAYIAADILGDGSTNAYSYFYAVDTAPEGSNPNTAPSVRMTGPAQRESFEHLSDITVTAEASDAEGPVTKVEFYRSARGKATLIGTDTTAPYSAVAEDVPGDNYALYAVAYDEQGLNTTSEGVFVQVTYWPPTAELTSPANGAWFPALSDVTLTAQPDPRDGRISRIEFIHENAETICTVSAPPYTCVWQDRPAGVYTVFARTFDDGVSHINSEPVTFAVGEGRTALHTISGRAFEADGTSIGGATVTLERGGRMQPITVTTTTTDAHGRYSFKNLEPHYSYDVEAHHPDFSFQPSPTVGPFVDLSEDKVRDWKGKRPEPRPEGAPPVAWASYYGSPERLLDGRTMLALDGQGNSFVAGESGMNFAVVKYDPAGRQLWARVVDGGGRYQTSTYDIGTDAAGSVYVTGQMWAGTAHERDWLTIKFDAAGNELWRRTYNGPSSLTEYPSALEVDAAGNVYVAGEGGAVFDGGRSVTTIKYDTDGNVLWTRSETGNFAQDIKLDAAGNAYVIGVDGGRAHVFKYDPAGDLLWKYAHSTGAATEQAVVWSVHLGGDGGVYVLAEVSGGDSPTGVGYGPVVLKVNGADGRLAWVSHIGRKDGQRLPMAVYAMDVDPAGNAYVTGLLDISAEANKDAFTLKVGAADGAVQWMDVYAEPAGGGYSSRWNAENNIVVDAAGNAYSYFTSMREWDDDVVVIKYRTDGSRVWVHLFDNPYHSGDAANDLNSVGRNILLDAQGDVIFTGDSQIPGHSLDFVTVKLDQGPDAGPTPTPTPAPSPTPTPAPTYSISGRVELGDGSHAPLGDVTVTLGGSTSATTKTDSAGGGNYFFNGLQAGGSYTVTPSKAGYAFSPASHTVNGLSADRGAHFTATPVPAPAAVNHALKSNGGTVLASSSYGPNYPASSLNNGDRRGLNWNAGGGWNDASANLHPDWVEVYFNGAKSVSEVNVFTLQDAPAAPSEPTEAMQFTKYGVTAFEVRYWTGAAWEAVPGASVTGNDRVWRRFTFPAVQTSRIRVVVTGALAGYSRLTEVEAWGAASDAPAPQPAARVNAALAANGGTVLASSSYGQSYPASSLINGDRRGVNWNAGGGWNDATAHSHPDWVEVAFAGGARPIDEVGVFTLQDDPAAPSEPTETTTFSKYGTTGLEVQYWTDAGWAQVPGGLVVSTDRVWNRFTFPAVTTTKIRVLVNNALAGYSRLVEVEAWGPAAARVNHALVSNGASVTASSSYGQNYPASSLNNGDRRGVNWNSGGGWNDATADSYPDWVEVSFGGVRSLTEVDVFTLQDNPAAPSEPTEALAFTKYGVTAMRVEFWNGSAWAPVPGASVTGNDRVWRKFTFPALSTQKIRVVVTGALAGYSRLTEVEAY